MEIVILILNAAIIFCGAAYSRRIERTEWNDGVCRYSGLAWRHFDTDSQGGRGYTDGAGHYCWISWGFDLA